MIEVRNHIEQSSVKDLLVIAKEMNIVGRHDMKKAELIEKINDYYALKIKVYKPEVSHIKSLEEELVAESDNEWEKVDESQCFSEVKPERMPVRIARPKKDYISNIEKGTIIAFKISNEKAISGMIDEIKGDGEFTVRTKNGIRFSVWANNIIWVKTGDRWPKGVYLALKGESEVNEH